MREVDVARMIAGCTASAAMLLAPTARAAPCAIVVTAEHLPPIWAADVEALRAEVARIPASECQPTTLVLESVDGGVRITATRSDGSRTERKVETPQALVPTALGLVLTIPAESPPPPRAAEPPPPVPSPVRPTVLAVVPPVVAPRSLGIWTGVSAGVKLTAPTDLTVLDVEARADLVLEHWLLLATIRSALVSCLGGQGVDCDAYNDVSLGVGVARRFPAGNAEIDVAFQPSVVFMHMEYDTSSEAVSFAASEITLRLDALARLAVPLNRDWALTVTVDAGVAPNLVVRPVQLDVPAGMADEGQPPFFPAWTGGVRLGARGALL